MSGIITEVVVSFAQAQVFNPGGDCMSRVFFVVLTLVALVAVFCSYQVGRGAACTKACTEWYGFRWKAGTMTSTRLFNDLTCANTSAVPQPVWSDNAQLAGTCDSDPNDVQVTIYTGTAVDDCNPVQYPETVTWTDGSGTVMTTKGVCSGSS